MRLVKALLVAGLLWGILIALALNVRGETRPQRVGRAPLFLLTARFNVRAYLRTAPQKPHAIAILWDVPRRRLRNLSIVLRRSRVAEVELVLINETCVHNRACEPREILSRYTPTTFRVAVRRSDPALKNQIIAESSTAIAEVSARIGDRRLIVSPLLETRLSRAGWERVAGWTRGEHGQLPLVFNPLVDDGGGRPELATYIEKHGFDLWCEPDGRTIANLDGSRGSIPEMQGWLKRTEDCRLSLLWVAADNCRSENEKQFIAPSSRRCADDFEKIRRTLK